MGVGVETFVEFLSPSPHSPDVVARFGVGADEQFPPHVAPPFVARDPTPFARGERESTTKLEGGVSQKVGAAELLIKTVSNF